VNTFTLTTAVSSIFEAMSGKVNLFLCGRQAAILPSLLAIRKWWFSHYLFISSSCHCFCRNTSEWIHEKRTQW